MLKWFALSQTKPNSGSVNWVRMGEGKVLDSLAKASTGIPSNLAKNARAGGLRRPKKARVGGQRLFPLHRFFRMPALGEMGLGLGVGDLTYSRKDCSFSAPFVLASQQRLWSHLLPPGCHHPAVPPQRERAQLQLPPRRGTSWDAHWCSLRQCERALCHRCTLAAASQPTAACVGGEVRGRVPHLAFPSSSNSTDLICIGQNINLAIFASPSFDNWVNFSSTASQNQMSVAQSGDV